MSTTTTKPKSCMSDPKAYDRWKTMIPYLYDFFTNNKLTWPSLSCRWGSVYGKKRQHSTRQRIYLSEQTDGTEPNKLIVANADVVRPRIAAADSLSNFQENTKSPFIRNHFSVIYHPGEVNKIRECIQYPNLVVTHTDSPKTYLWNVKEQPDRKRDKANVEPSKPDMVLLGHEDNAEFALASSKTSPAFASGGKDKLVVLWSLADSAESLNEPPKQAKESRVSWNSGGVGYEASPSLQPRRKFRGHKDTVEEVAFHPSSSDKLVSVADDKSMLFWDARVGDQPVLSVLDAHDSDVQCVDWNPLDEHYILTGAADASVKLFDTRKIESKKGQKKEVKEFLHHTEGILKVEWNPVDKDVFASGGEDGIINVWDLKRKSNKSSNIPSELLFQHAGHRAQIVDFQWNPEDEWTILSLSNDQDVDSVGGTLQIWRMNDMIYRPQDEVLAELEKYRNKILHKKEAA